MGKPEIVWIYLSPHLDDGVYSCGGLMWEQVRRGEQVTVWTVCAGDPPPNPLSSFAETLHKRWGTGRETVALRRWEDEQACQRLGALTRHFNVPDCIYRRHPKTGEALYASEKAIFGKIKEVEIGLIEKLISFMEQKIPRKMQLVCPLSIGGHVDHRLTRQVAEGLGRPLVYYGDYPYIEREETRARMKDLVPDGFTSLTAPVSEMAIEAWVEAMGMYGSQLNTFWSDQEGMEADVREYKQRHGGVVLWRASES